MTEQNPDGVGSDGTIPDSDDGLAVTVGGASHFNEEEDDAATPDAASDDAEDGGSDPTGPGAGVRTEG